MCMYVCVHVCTCMCVYIYNYCYVYIAVEVPPRSNKKKIDVTSKKRSFPTPEVPMKRQLISKRRKNIIILFKFFNK